MAERHEAHGHDDAEGIVTESADEELLRLLTDADSWVNDVVEVYESSERNYRAAVMAGTVVSGLSDTTNL